MRFYPYYEENSPLVRAEFIKSQNHGSLLTVKEVGVNIGIFNHHLKGDKLYLHLQKDDEQLVDLGKNPRCQFVIYEFLAVIPSHWVEARYGGAATSYYRYLEFDCEAKILEIDAFVKALRGMLEHYQPEGKYDPIEKDSKLYKGSIAQIVGLELTSIATRSKWKLGQNRPTETRLKVARHLFERGLPGDLVAAALIEEACAV